ncbi:hypothetical protein FRC10_009882, partial [Ceratobasidium sp. 414]
SRAGIVVHYYDMPPSIFTLNKRKYIVSYLSEWNSLSGAAKECDPDGNLFSPKDQFIDKVIESFFSKYP